MMRDLADNVVIICSIENVDPMVRGLLSTYASVVGCGMGMAARVWFVVWRRQCQRTTI